MNESERREGNGDKTLSSPPPVPLPSQSSIPPPLQSLVPPPFLPHLLQEASQSSHLLYINIMVSDLFAL
ncbi:uncharacterized protein DS421_19g660260 [Arachis hypogaea]|uniref:Uncharacterized protein n=1 Tax=Arachis hypogaea TaxID=3818 RepID=A0A6B9V9Z3_ARAHY|nr:uncharacterized protein DS421_19g660260 [Arachis hypogaea]